MSGIEQVETKVAELIEELTKDLGVEEGRRVLTKTIMEILEQASGLIITGYDIDRIRVLAGSDTIKIHHLDAGKTLLISGLTYDIRQDESGYHLALDQGQEVDG